MSDSSSLVERQIALEEEQSALGAARYRALRRPWQSEDGSTKPESELGPGAHLMRAAVLPMETALKTFMIQMEEGLGGRKAAAYHYLRGQDLEAIAFITAKRVVNGLLLKEVMQAAGLNIGTLVRDHIEMSAFKVKEPGLYHFMVEDLKKSTSARHRARVMRRITKRMLDHKLDWDQGVCATVGLKLLELFAESTGMIQFVTLGQIKQQRVMVQPTPEVDKWLNAQHSRCELLSPMYLPMLIEPNPWVGTSGGGYLTRTNGRLKLVKTRNHRYLEDLNNVEMPLVYESVNALQKVPWRINKFVHRVMLEAWRTGGGLAGLPDGTDAPLPLRPLNIDHNPEVLRGWKRAASAVHAANNRLRVSRIRLAQVMWMADKFAPEDRFFYPYQLDFRGRVYPVAGVGSINPQGDDVGKSLLEFADGAPLGEDGPFWLAVHLANTFGFDKVSLEERAQWVLDNEELILDSVLSPLDGRLFWTKADKPWCFLAAARDWYGYKSEGSQYVSRVPVAMDGSCNGLQNFSAMLRDHIGGAATNLAPATKPSDIYSLVAAEAELLLSGLDEPLAIGWRGKVTRKIAKRPVMTLPYGATKFGMRDQILEEIQKNNPGLPPAQLPEYAQFLAGVIWEAIGRVVVAARQAMGWLQSLSKTCSSVNLPLHWTTPVGFIVRQDYKSVTRSRKKVHFDGKVYELVFAFQDEVKNQIDGRKQAAAISPNFVHSLDAAHMMRSVVLCVENNITQLAMIHDSYGCPAAQVSEMNALLRHAFVEQYRPNVLQQFMDEILEQLPDKLKGTVPGVPSFGELDLERVTDSEFFFA